jgi:chitodextrinase
MRATDFELDVVVGGSKMIRSARRRVQSALVVAMVVAALAPAQSGVWAAVVGDSCGTSASPGGYTVSVCISTPDGPLSGAVPVTAAAETSVTTARIASLAFSLDGEYLLTDYESPYEFSWPSEQIRDGDHVLSAVAVLRDGYRSAAVTVAVTTDNGNGGTPPGPTSGFEATSGTTPAPGAPFVVAALGDGAGGETAATKVTDLVSSWQPNLVTYLGDVYAKGTYTEFVNWYGTGSELFSAFREQTNPIIGNHEYSADPNAEGYFRYWNGIPHYYDYVANGWHFYALDSTSQFNQTEVGSAQYEWLKTKLEQESGQCSVIYFHHPMYNIGDQEPATRMKGVYDLAVQHDVTMILTGHDHTYQRWMPLNANGEVDPSGVTQIVTGNGGHSSMNVATTDERVASWSKGFGAVRMELYADRADIAFYLVDGTPTGRLTDTAHVPCQALPRDTSAPTSPTSPTTSVTRPEGQSTSQVELTWGESTDDRGVSEYRVQRDGVDLVALPATARSWTDDGVRESTTYIYSIVAMDAWGNRSNPAAAPSVTTPAPIPVTLTVTVSADTYVKDATATNYGRATVLRASGATPALTAHLSFTLSGLQPDIRSARLQILATSNGAKGVQVRTVSGNWSEYLLNGVNDDSLLLSAPITALASFSPGWIDLDVTSAVVGNGQLNLALTTGTTQQSYASREAGTPARLVIDSAPLPDTTTPSPPTGVTGTVLDESTVRIDWLAASDPSGIDDYVIYRDGTRIGTVASPDTSFIDPTPNAAQPYSYTVTAVDSAGNESSPSSAVSLTTPDISAPEEPESVVVIATSATSARILWEPAEDNVGATEYSVYRDGDVVGTTGEESLEDTQLAPGTPYEYTVVARDAAGNTSVASDEVEVTTPGQTEDTVPPPAPTGVSAVAGPQPGEAVVSWTASDAPDVATYRVYRNGFPVSAALPSTDSSWTDSGLASAGAYTYQVEAADSAGNHSALSEPAHFASPDTQPPTIPTSLNAAVNGLTATLTWTAAADDVGVHHYVVERNGAVVSDTVWTTTWTDSGLAPETSYTYSVRAVDAVGNTSGPSLHAIAVTPSPVTQTLVATGDAYVSEAAPNTSYGKATVLRVDDASPEQRSFIQFTATVARPTVTKAVLRFYATNTAIKGVTVYSVPSTSWNESITWNTKPALGSVIATVPATPTGGGWMQVDVTPLVQANSAVAFGLTLPATATTAVPFSSREGANAPQLVVTTSY